MRIIDADALPSVKFHAVPYTHITPSDVNAESYKRGWNDAIDAIVDCMPTIDAVPVVHGKWIDDKSTIVGDIIERYCSLCGQRMTSCIDRLMPYCPNCGATMDGGADNG